ncbi:MAG: hypothetical protein SXQ77_12255 [Halobacteria archaeon]|nr:hypothetical protein [Halobacteria archaeon]
MDVDMGEIVRYVVYVAVFLFLILILLGLFDPNIVPDTEPPEVDFSAPPEEIAYKSVERIEHQDYTVNYSLWVENTSTDERRQSVDLSIKVDTDAKRYLSSTRQPHTNYSGSIYADDGIYWKKTSALERWHGEAERGIGEELWLLSHNIDSNLVFGNIGSIRESEASVINRTEKYVTYRLNPKKASSDSGESMEKT